MGNPLLDAALEYANRGWPIFPARADKTPFTKNGVLDATTNIRQIESWWTTEFPNANIALDVGSAGMMVLDLDPGHSLEELENNVGNVSDTQLKSRTPRGGQHLYFALNADEIVSPSASRLGVHVDVRSFHSYVLLPPSATNAGNYDWEETGKPAFRSDEMVRLSNAGKERSDQRDEWIIKPDLEPNIILATEWLKTQAKIATEGEGGDHCAYSTAAMCKSYGISEELALDLMWEHWNPRCDPPWQADEIDHLKRKVENAYAYNTSPPGNLTPDYHTARTSKLFTPVGSDLPDGDETRVAGFRIADRTALRFIKPPDWLIKDFIPDEAYAMLFGAYSTFKTFIALDLALTIACEYTNDQQMWEATTTGPVLFMAGEGRSSMAKRVSAWEHVHNEGEEVDNFVLMDPVPRLDITEEYMAALVDELLRRHPGGYKLIVIDTVGRAMAGTDENAQQSATAFTDLVQRLRAELGGSVLALHHSGHSDKDRGRGSSVFGADPDTLVRVDREGKADVVSLSMTKQKDAPEWEKSKSAKLIPYSLPDNGGDSLVVGKAKAKDLPRHEGNAADTLFMKTLDDHLATVLSDNPTRYYSQNVLVEILAQRMTIPERNMDKHVKRLRTMPDTAANRCYDPERSQKSGKWGWKD